MKKDTYSGTEVGLIATSSAVGVGMGGAAPLILVVVALTAVVVYGPAIGVFILLFLALFWPMSILVSAWCKAAQEHQIHSFFIRLGSLGMIYLSYFLFGRYTLPLINPLAAHVYGHENMGLEGNLLAFYEMYTSLFIHFKG